MVRALGSLGPLQLELFTVAAIVGLLHPKLLWSEYAVLCYHGSEGGLILVPFLPL